jgi:hypothetical protein
MEHGEDEERLLPEADADAVNAQFAGASIELKRTEADDLAQRFLFERLGRPSIVGEAGRYHAAQ